MACPAFPNLSGQAVQHEIHLSRLIGVDRLVQAGKCLLYNANQYSLMLAVMRTQATVKAKFDKEHNENEKFV
jgi:hypothetical protein